MTKLLESLDGSDDILLEENKRLLLIEDDVIKTMHKLLFSYYHIRLQTFCDRSVELLETLSSLINCKQDLQCKANRLKVSILFFF